MKSEFLPIPVRLSTVRLLFSFLMSSCVILPPSHLPCLSYLDVLLCQVLFFLWLSLFLEWSSSSLSGWLILTFYISAKMSPPQRGFILKFCTFYVSESRITLLLSYPIISFMALIVCTSLVGLLSFTAISELHEDIDLFYLIHYSYLSTCKKHGS